MISKMQEHVDQIVKLREQAQISKDVTKLNSLNEKLNSAQKLTQLAKQNYVDLNQAIATNNAKSIQQHSTLIRTAYSKSTQLYQEAQTALGTAKPLTGEGVEVTTKAPQKVAPPKVTSKPILTSPGDISGRLVDIDGISAHQQARLKLIRLPDQTVIEESVSDNVGNYAFSGVKAGEYNLQVGKAVIRVLVAQGLPTQPLNLVIPRALVATGVATGAGTALSIPVTWTTATWAGGTVVVVTGGTVGVLAVTDNLTTIGLGDSTDDEVPVTATTKKSLPPTPPPPPPTVP